MLKKIFKFTSCLLIIASVTGCTLINEDSNLKSTSIYTITENIYTDEEESLNKHIEIKYPTISGLDNKAIQQIINEQVKNIAFEVLKDFASLDEMDIRTTYSIELSDSKFISLIYTTRSFHSAQAYPLIRTHAVNFELDTGNMLKLDDIININENFIGIFSEKFENICEYNSIEDKEKVNQYIAEMISYDLFLNSNEGTFPEISGYLTDDSLVISIAVPYWAGSFVLYSAKYSDIIEYLKIDIS